MNSKHTKLSAGVISPRVSPKHTGGDELVRQRPVAAKVRMKELRAESRERRATCTVMDALLPLDPAAQSRVLNYLADRFKIKL